MRRDKIILCVAGLLLFIGLYKPSLDWLRPPIPTPTVVDIVEIEAPKDKELKALAENVRDCFLNSSSSTRETDARLLANLYKDIAVLISLNSTNEVITTTEAIRQANVLCGAMLNLDIKGKYEGLANAAEQLLSSTIGIDNVKMTKELREKSVNCFNALSWACQEGSK